MDAGGSRLAPLPAADGPPRSTAGVRTCPSSCPLAKEKQLTNLQLQSLRREWRARAHAPWPRRRLGGRGESPPPQAPPTFPALTAAVERSWTPLAPIPPLPVRGPGRRPAEFAPHEASCRRRRAERGARAACHCAKWEGGGRGTLGTCSSSWEGAVVVGMGIAAGCAVVEWGGNVGVPTCVSCGLLALPCEPPPPPPRYDVVATAVFGWGGFLPVAGPSTVWVGSSAVGCLISLSFLRLTAEELVSRQFPPGHPPVLVCGVDRALTRWPRCGPTERSPPPPRHGLRHRRRRHSHRRRHRDGCRLCEGPPSLLASWCPRSSPAPGAVAALGAQLLSRLPRPTTPTQG